MTVEINESDLHANWLMFCFGWVISSDAVRGDGLLIVMSSHVSVRFASSLPEITAVSFSRSEKSSFRWYSRTRKSSMKPSCSSESLDCVMLL